MASFGDENLLNRAKIPALDLRSSKITALDLRVRLQTPNVTLHATSIALSLVEMRDKGLFVDVTLRSNDGKEYRAHKVLMARLGQFFLTAFTHPSFQGEINIEASSDILECLIDMAYGGRCTINPDNVLDLLRISVMYQLDSITEAATQFVSQHLSPSDALHVYTFVKAYQCEKKLVDIVQTFIRRHFSQVSKDEQFYSLSNSELEDMMVEDDLNIDEEDLLDLVLSMKDAGWKDKNDILKLLAFVRSSLINPFTYYKKLESLSPVGPIAERYFQAKEIALPPSPNSSRKLVYGLLNNSRYDSLNQWKKGDHPRKPREVAIAMGGHRSLEIYNIRTNQWKFIRAIKKGRADLEYSYPNHPFIPSVQNISFDGFGLAAIGGRVYCVGGKMSCDRSPRDTLCSLDLSTGRWSRRKSMSVARAGVAVVVFGGKLVVMGGYSNINQMDIMGGYTSEKQMELVDLVEEYDPQQDQWRYMSSLITKRTQAASVVFDRTIFIIGGMTHREEPLDTVEYFNQEFKEWRLCGHLKSPRGEPTAVVHEDKIFVIGGQVDGKAVECFEVVWSKSVPTLICVEVPDMIVPKTAFAATVMDNKILVTGGLVDGKAGKGCEMYCLEYNTWSRGVEELMRERAGHKCVTIDTTKCGFDTIENLNVISVDNDLEDYFEDDNIDLDDYFEEDNIDIEDYF